MTTQPIVPTLDTYRPGVYGDLNRNDLRRLPNWIVNKAMFGRQSECLYSCLCLLWDIEYELTQEFVSFEWDGMCAKLSRREVNIFYFCLTFARGEDHFFLTLENLAENYPVGFKYEFFAKKPPKKGQAKILVGTLEGLIDAPQEINIVVIGSGSHKHIVGGKTYDTIARFLSGLGYRGTMDLYDPEEISETVIIQNFVVNRVASAIVNFIDLKMINGATPFVIYDDAFVRDYGNRVEPQIQTVRVRPQEIVPGEHCYVLSSVGDIYYLDTGLVGHKDVESILLTRKSSKIHGGGHYLYDKFLGEISFFGESGTYGRPDLDILASVMSAGPYVDLFSKYYLGYGYRGHDPAQTVLSNECRVSIKAIEGVQIPLGCALRDQFYYYKKEKRLVKNFPKIPVHFRDIGDGCVACVQLARILAGIKSYNGTDPYERMKLLLTGHVVRSCLKEVGTTQAEKLSIVRGHAWKEISYELGLHDFCQRYPSALERDYKRLITFAGVSMVQQPIDVRSPKVAGLPRKLVGSVWKYKVPGKDKEEMPTEPVLTYRFKKSKERGSKMSHLYTRLDFALSLGGAFMTIKCSDDTDFSKFPTSKLSNATLYVDLPESTPKQTSDRMLIDALDIKYVNMSIWFMVSTYGKSSLWAPIERSKTKDDLDLLATGVGRALGVFFTDVKNEESMNV